MTNVLILGASGLLGSALLKELNTDFNVYGTYNISKFDFPEEKLFQFNINDINEIHNILLDVKPKIVVSALRGNFENQLSAHIEIANYLKSIDGQLYFCSTANVFDDDSTKAHYENHIPRAESDYGNYKIKCEEAITEILGENAIILRLPMIWGKPSPRLDDLVSKLSNHEEIELYTNLYVNHNIDVFLAKQIRYIIENNLIGIFHLGSTSAMNYYKFATELISRLGYEDVKIKETSLPLDEYYLAILSNRNELPPELKLTNEDILTYLTC